MHTAMHASTYACMYVSVRLCACNAVAQLFVRERFVAAALYYTYTGRRCVCVCALEAFLPHPCVQLAVGFDAFPF